MVISINEFPINKFAQLVCISDREIITLQKGLEDKWKMCFECGAIYCAKCLIDLSLYSENMCLGSKSTFSHKIKSDQIPLNDILLYTYRVRNDIFQDPVYQLFSAPNQNQFDPTASDLLDFDPFLEKSNLNSKEKFWRQERCVRVRFPQSTIFDLSQPENIKIRHLDMSEYQNIFEPKPDNEDVEKNISVNESDEIGD